MTALMDPDTAIESDDSDAIAELHRLHRVQRAGFLADPYPSIEERQGHLMLLAKMVLAHREQIRAAMIADFAVSPELFTDLVEVLGVAGRAAYAAEQLQAWTAGVSGGTVPTVGLCWRVQPGRTSIVAKRGFPPARFPRADRTRPSSPCRTACRLQVCTLLTPVP